MVKTLNTEFTVEHCEDNINIIYVESLNNVYKDLYHATSNGEKSVLKAIEEGDDFIVASTKLTIEGKTSKQLVRVEEGKKPRVCLNDSLYGIITESNKVAVEKVIEEKKAAKQAKTDAVTNLIVGALDDQVKAMAAKAKMDFDGVVEESNKRVEEAKNKDVVVEEIVVVEKAEEALVEVEEEISATAMYLERQLLEDYNPEEGDKEFQGDMVTLKAELETKIKNLFSSEKNNFRKIAEMSSGGGSGGDIKQTRENASNIAALSADVGEFNNVTASLKENFQGYLALLSGIYFGGAATTFNIPVEDVNTWLDVVLTVDPAGAFDYRVTSMKAAQAQGYTGTGALADPIIFLLEGLEQSSSADIRVSMSFNPDDDGGRLDSRLNFFRHSGTTPADNFHIEASSLAMESGAEEEYAYTPDIKFFIGDTIDTNGPGDAGRVCFQVKSDVPGTVTMNEIAMFIQK